MAYVLVLFSVGACAVVVRAAARWAGLTTGTALHAGLSRQTYRPADAGGERQRRERETEIERGAHISRHRPRNTQTGGLQRVVQQRSPQRTRRGRGITADISGFRPNPQLPPPDGSGNCGGGVVGIVTDGPSDTLSLSTNYLFDAKIW